MPFLPCLPLPPPHDREPEAVTAISDPCVDRGILRHTLTPQATVGAAVPKGPHDCHDQVLSGCRAESSALMIHAFQEPPKPPFGSVLNPASGRPCL
ncbi:hypothetical protein AAFF_G00352500 [Aldrovandia affinis]|uniref:Uncharacterized protein n=1 Tax=Aldrovandia affinis TaxID=143900 RepID=A0AAD7SJ64_9TELE|nr:hypothetical protein AAFF_G00352500 [Aldrovandia affinis]